MSPTPWWPHTHLKPYLLINQKTSDTHCGEHDDDDDDDTNDEEPIKKPHPFVRLTDIVEVDMF